MVILRMSLSALSPFFLDFVAGFYILRTHSVVLLLVSY